jgi:hypothetical protein
MLCPANLLGYVYQFTSHERAPLVFNLNWLEVSHQLDQAAPRLSVEAPRIYAGDQAAKSKGVSLDAPARTAARARL